MKKINFNGKEYEAYHLIMRRENAEAILRGEKTVEFRAYTDRYCKMFLNLDNIAKNEKLCKEGRESECLPICRSDIEVVHFYNYNNTFNLDVAIDEIGVVTLRKQDADFLSKEFGCHELDNEWQQYESLPDEQKPSCFYLHIAEVLQSKGL